MLTGLPTLVPLGVAVVMAVIFRQPGFLIFGLMAPLMTATQALVKKHETARAKAQETLEREKDSGKKQRVAQEAVQQWRHECHERHPAVTHWLANPLWRPDPLTNDTVIRVGCAAATPPNDVGWGNPVPGIPVTVPLLSSLAIVGNGKEAAAVWRAMYSQALAVVNAGGSPAPAQGAGWQENHDPPAVLDIPHPATHEVFRWSLTSQAGDISPHVTWVIAVASERRVSIYHRGILVWGEVEPDTLSFATARWVRARVLGKESSPGGASPVVDETDRRALWCEVSEDTPPIDLVRMGPHGVVWGKTGSGKSVLIQRLVVSLCARYTPDQVSVVGIDFKGGATLATLTGLPHVQGLLTDLTPQATHRVTRSLRAEIRRREQLFADCGVSTWADLPATIPCPRSVIVVDEAGVVHAEAPELMAVLSDVASRGRSLGLHLLLATQRPHHLPRNIIANCPLRLCLAVTDGEEASQYLSDVPRHLMTGLLTGPPGTVLVPRSGGQHQLTTIQPVSPDEVGTILGRGHQASRPLWQEGLPPTVRVDTVCNTADLSPGKYLVGLGDYPDTQCQEPVWFRPASDGPLLIVGESGSGHTLALSLLVSQARRAGVRVVWSGKRIEELCDCLLQLTATTSADAPAPVLVVVDRLDRILAGCGHETQAWVVDALQALSVRLGQWGRGAGLVLTIAPGSPVFSAVARWSTSRFLLRHRDSDQWVQSGGDPSVHDPQSCPGRGVWAGVVAQWATPPPEDSDSQCDRNPVPSAPPGALVVRGFTAPREDREGVWSVATAEASWQKIRHAIDQAGGVVFQGVSVSVMRQLVGPGHDYPPVVTADPYGWLVSTGGCALVCVDG